MRSLNYRTGAVHLRREPLRKRKPCLVEPKPRRSASKHLGTFRGKPKVYLNWKNPLRANYYYMKSARGKCKIGSERSAHGIRWNYYLRHGKRIPRIAPSFSPRFLIFSSGILRCMSPERQSFSFKKDAKNKQHDRQNHKEKTNILKLERSPSPKKQNAERPKERCNGKMAKVIPITVHPEFIPYKSNEHQSGPRIRKYKLDRTMTYSPPLVKAKATGTDGRMASPKAKHASRTPARKSIARLSGKKMRKTAEVNAAKSDTRCSIKTPTAQIVKAAKKAEKGSNTKPAETVHVPNADVIALQPIKVPHHIGYISSGEKKRAVQLKVGRADPELPR